MSKRGCAPAAAPAADVCLQSCVAVIPSGAVKPAGNAELQHGPGDLWGGADALAARLLRQARALLPSVISGRLRLGECNELLFPAS